MCRIVSPGCRPAPPPACPAPQAFVEAQNTLTQGVLAQCDTREPFRKLYTRLFDYEKYGKRALHAVWCAHAVLFSDC